MYSLVYGIFMFICTSLVEDMYKLMYNKCTCSREVIFRTCKSVVLVLSARVTGRVTVTTPIDQHKPSQRANSLHEYISELTAHISGEECRIDENNLHLF